MSIFTDHPHSVGESYAEHAKMAASFGSAMIKGGLGCFVHAFFPFLCKSSGSKTILALHNRMIRARERFGPDDRRRGQQVDWCI